MPLLRPIKPPKTAKKSSKKGEKSGKSSKSDSKKSSNMTTRSSSRVANLTPLIKSAKSSKRESSSSSTKKRESKRLASSDSSIEISLPSESSSSSASSRSSSNNSTPKLVLKKAKIEKVEKAEKKSPKSPKKSPKTSPKSLSPRHRAITGASSKNIQIARQVLNQVKQENGLSYLPEAVVIESAVFNPRIAHRKRTAWSTKETRDLMKGVERHGEGKWALILHDKTLHFHPTRTAVDLKDKYRNITQYVEYKNRPMRKFVLVDSRHQPILSAAGGQTILNNR